MSPTVDGQYIDPNEISEGPLTEGQRLAKENILDHYRRPRNKRVIDSPTAVARDKNPLCGDEIEVMVVLEDGTISEIAFQGKGCAISQASMSMLSRRLKGKKPEEVLQMGQEEILEMLGIPIGIVRRKCAMLGLRVTQEALHGA